MRYALENISTPPTVSELCTLLVFLLDVIPLVRQPEVNCFEVFRNLKSNNSYCDYLK